jgi:hypothetical protein
MMIKKTSNSYGQTHMFYNETAHNAKEKFNRCHSKFNDMDLHRHGDAKKRVATRMREKV